MYAHTAPPPRNPPAGVRRYGGTRRRRRDPWDFRSQRFERNDRSVEFEVIAEASGAIDSIGPMTREYRQYIARRGATYWLIEDDDGDYSFTRVAYSDDQLVGIARAVSRSSAFVLGRHGLPVSVWGDADLDTEIDGEDVIDDEDADELDQPTAEVQQLWATRIVDRSGVTLAGVGAAPTLPMPEPIYVMIAQNAGIASEMRRRGLDARPVTVIVDGSEHDAVAFEGVLNVTLLDIGLNVGDGRVWRLTADEVRLLDCELEAYVARALRDQV